MKHFTLGLISFLSVGISIGQNNENNSLPNSGNVGIGTTNPTAKLEVKGYAKFDSCSISHNLNINGLLKMSDVQAETPNEVMKWAVINEDGEVKSLSKGGALQTMYASDCFLLTDLSGNTTQQSSPVWKSSISSNGNEGYLTTGAICPAKVGIGTDTPRSPLDVMGTTSSWKLAIGQDPTTMDGLVHIKQLVANPNQTLFRVDSDFGQLLNLNGAGLLRAREIKVDMDTWPDYVFEEGYERMPLNEVKNYIALNGHLPNVPSAAVIETEGMNIAEMNKVLMEKIEELTLHLIDLNEKIEVQQQQIIELTNH